MQRVPVILDIDTHADQPSLRAGMTATVRIDTRHQRKLPALVENLVSRSTARRVRYE